MCDRTGQYYVESDPFLDKVIFTDFLCGTLLFKFLKPAKGTCGRSAPRKTGFSGNEIVSGLLKLGGRFKFAGRYAGDSDAVDSESPRTPSWPVTRTDRVPGLG